MRTNKLLPTTYKLLVLIGPTASGKSELAVQLAKRFNGEIVSCDSRQIYKGLDLGTGKVQGRWKNHFFVYKGIRHYCIDYVNPRRQYSAALFQKDANQAISKITAKNKLPILCGGTAHWIDAVAFNQPLPDIKPSPKLRKLLEKHSTAELLNKLKKLDPARANNIDKNNRRRLIRALEIVIISKQPVPLLPTPNLPALPAGRQPPTSNLLWLGIKTEQSQLYKKIEVRLKQRLRQGMIKEVNQLHGKGLSWKKLESFGLEYKFIAQYLQKKLSYEEMTGQLSYAIKHYSKRQLTWWKKNKQIIWIKTLAQSQKLVERFIK